MYLVYIFFFIIWYWFVFSIKKKSQITIAHYCDRKRKINNDFLKITEIKYINIIWMERVDFIVSNIILIVWLYFVIHDKYSFKCIIYYRNPSIYLQSLSKNKIPHTTKKSQPYFSSLSFLLWQKIVKCFLISNIQMNFTSPYDSLSLYLSLCVSFNQHVFNFILYNIA